MNDHLPLTNDMPNCLMEPCERCGTRDKGGSALCDPCENDHQKYLKERIDTERQFADYLEAEAERHVFEKHGVDP